MACAVKNCRETCSKKSLMCCKHWYSLPQSLRDDVRKGMEKGQHTMRVHPSREWLAAASKIVGDIHNLTVWVGVDSKVSRRFDKDKPKQAAA